jgi:hypothetical protein
MREISSYLVSVRFPFPWFCSKYIPDKNNLTRHVHARPRVDHQLAKHPTPPPPPDIQTDLESKPFHQVLNFWCLFYRKMPPPVERFRFIIQNLGSSLTFLLAKLPSLTIWPFTTRWPYLRNGRSDRRADFTSGRRIKNWTHFQTRRTDSFWDMGILRRSTCWKIVAKQELFLWGCI